ncbi:CLUMA_CG014992, isoform A [Clunio marinus]|uniref:CLUMA_CG014992, isoform A n=1 Tax=Clunio marinus TaxID=568069 RepID=A0A1J1INN9_9DIPT|nr:CLUMA_CG014992, isoform A [Clunio marinus]
MFFNLQNTSNDLEQTTKDTKAVTIDADKESSRVRKTYWGYHRQGSCQAGFSAAITKSKTSNFGWYAKIYLLKTSYLTSLTHYAFKRLFTIVKHKRNSKSGDRLFIGAPGSWYWQVQFIEPLKNDFTAFNLISFKPQNKTHSVSYISIPPIMSRKRITQHTLINSLLVQTNIQTQKQ